MGRRIDVELTSARDDGTWTWRAAGAKQPKGVVPTTLLYEGAKVGDVVRAEADFEVDGIFITSVQPPKEKRRPGPERLEVIGPPREHRPVTSTLTSRPGRPDRGAKGEDSARRAARRGDDDRRDRSGEPSRQAAQAGHRRPKEVRHEDGGRRGGADRAQPGRRMTGERPRLDRSQQRDRGTGGAERGDRADRGDRAERRERQPQRAEAPPSPRPKRLSPGNAHRAAVLATLSPEQRPIAEEVLRGGIPGLRQAIEAQNARLRAQGDPEVRAEPLVAIAEQLLPQLKTAEWRDRAEAAVKMLDDISVRDLRSVVTGADAAARDDDTRLLASKLREALEGRVAEHRQRWVDEIAAALDEGRLVRALRLSAHPPDPGTRFPADLALRLSEAASTAMAPDVAADRWLTLLGAVAESPVRRSVKPSGLPAGAGEEVLHAARQAAGRVPALAALLGIEMPPPPGPPRPPRATQRPRAPRPPRRPPPPPAPVVELAPDAPVPVVEPAPPPVPAPLPEAGPAPAEPAGDGER